MINIRKRNNLYEYRFEVGKVNGKRKQISKSGFKTKRDAYIAGQRAYEEFINGENTKECNMLYSEYLDGYNNPAILLDNQDMTNFTFLYDVLSLVTQTNLIINNNYTCLLSSFNKAHIRRYATALKQIQCINQKLTLLF